MIKVNYVLLVLFLLICCEASFSQQEVLPDPCDGVIKQDLSNNIEKDTLIRLIRIKDEPGCSWRDRETGFADKVWSLVKITSLQEKIELFNDTSANLKYYLFPSILIENDSIGFELLKNSVSDTAAMVSVCACMVQDNAIGFRIAYLYYHFIELKYHLGVSGTIEGIPFWIYNHHRKHPNRKMWQQKLSVFKSVVQQSIPHFKDYLYPTALKAWN